MASCAQSLQEEDLKSQGDTGCSQNPTPQKAPSAALAGLGPLQAPPPSWSPPFLQEPHILASTSSGQWNRLKGVPGQLSS